jgi:hypothetical protein
MKPRSACARKKGAHKLTALFLSGEPMSRKILVTLIILSLSLSVHAQTNSSHEIKHKRQVVEYGTNQNVKAKLTSGEALTGRIAEIKNESFTLQLVDQAGQVTSREIAYAELSKVTKVGGEKASRTFKRGILHGAGVYAGMLAVMLVMFGIAAAVSH